MASRAAAVMRDQSEQPEKNKKCPVGSLAAQGIRIYISETVYRMTDLLLQPLNGPFDLVAFFAADDAPLFALQAQHLPVG